MVGAVYAHFRIDSQRSTSELKNPSLDIKNIP
jgi:hypothetical protein